ncbi:MAG TPA: hypothetical protein VFR56_02515 [Actinomycetes bacterium]|nr:hypothetical protein [Actinomycetes bacterium]
MLDPEVVGNVMINARPGYWDMDRCSWVGVEPTYVVPPLRHADHPHDRVAGQAGIPAPRHRREEPAPLDAVDALEAAETVQAVEPVQTVETGQV